MFQRILPVTRNLLIINVICYLLQAVLQMRGIDITDWLGLHFILASQFNPLQLVTYMFLHGSLTHLFFNMFSLWMFGTIIERELGLKRFLIYYFVCGIGAALCQELWQMGDYLISEMYRYDYVNTGYAMMPMATYLNQWTTIGASGACYGILLAFGMFFPNERIMLLIPPIPMKAKYFVAGYAVIEVFSAYFSNDNVAHFAHLGGMLFGWLLLRLWRRKAQRRQNPFTGWDTWQTTRQKPTLWQRITKPFRNANAQQSRQKPINNDYADNIRSRQEEARMDELLDKVRRSGYDSLTQEERKELFYLSKK